MRSRAGNMPEPGTKTEMDGLAHSIDALFSDGPLPPSTDHPGPDTPGEGRTLVDVLRNPRYDAASRQRRLVVTGLAIAVILFGVLAVEATNHQQHLAELNTGVCRRNIAAAAVLALALVATTWAWFRARPKGLALLTLEEIRQRVPG